MATNNGVRFGNNQPPVGVIARTVAIAASIAQELGIKGAVPIAASGAQARGKHLSALLVDESAWPMSRDLKAVVMPSLKASAGYVLRLERFDPKTGLNKHRRKEL